MPRTDIEDTKFKSMDDQADWVMSLIDESAHKRSAFEHIWDETERNFLVMPKDEFSNLRSTKTPLDTILSSHNQSPWAILKDPETHQEVMSIVAGIIMAIFPPGETSMRAKGVGFEDIFKGEVVSKLLHYANRLPGHFVFYVQWLMGAGIYGTGLAEQFWRYREEPRTLRSVGINPETGEEETDSSIFRVPVYDDVRYETVPCRKFFNDPGSVNMETMRWAAREQVITAAEARRLAKAGAYISAKVEKAVSAGMAKSRDDSSDDEIQGTDEKKSHSSFGPMRRFRFIGDTPFDKIDGFGRREIVVLNGETVRSKPWPRRLPWFKLGLTPRLGSFWDIAPAEIIRKDQDFADVIKMMLADAAVRMTHPSPIISKQSGIRPDMLRRQRPDRGIPADGDPHKAVAWPDYNPPLAAAFNMQAGVKSQMREATSALALNQGIQNESQFRSATAFQGTAQRAANRPELFNRLMEQEYLPPFAKFTLELYQEFLDDSEALRERIGESSIPVFLADIMPRFDVEFLGSRIESNRANDLQALREVASMAANPAIAPLIPIIPVLQKFFRKIGQDDVAAMVANPQMMQLQIMLNQVAGANPANGNGNGENPAAPPAGALPAQLQGGLNG